VRHGGCVLNFLSFFSCYWELARGAELFGLFYYFCRVLLIVVAESFLEFVFPLPK